MTKSYTLPIGTKVFIFTFGLLTLPVAGMGILLCALAAKAKATFSDEAFEYWWLASYCIPWEGATVERLHPKRTSVYKITGISGQSILFKPGLFKNPNEIRANLEARINADVRGQPPTAEAPPR